MGATAPLVNADKREARLLVGDLAPTNVGFSADGNQAAVTALDDAPYDGAKPIRLYVVDVASGQRRQIAPTANKPIGPSWSPDGQWIAFGAQPDPGKPIDDDPSAPDGPHGVSEIWIVRPDGSDLHRIAVIDGFGGRLAWSPTGHRLTASLYNDNRVLVADIDAGTEQRWPFTQPYLVDWSPSGDKLVVSSDKGPTQLMNPATGALTKIADDACFPRWSPTSDVVAVRRAGIAGVIPAAGGLFRPFGPGSPVDWSSDGRSLDYQDTTWTVQVADAATGLSRTIASVDHGNGMSLSPTVWVPHARLVAVIVMPNAASYLP